MSNQVHNTTESSNYNFKRISIAKFTSVLYTKSRVALDGNKLFLRQVIRGFLGFIDNLEIIL